VMRVGVRLGDFWVSKWVIIVVVRYVASDRAVFRCFNESNMLMNSLSRENGSAWFWWSVTRWVFERSIAS
jgi:hypothetical protein